MNLIGEYQNGNYDVRIFSNGTKIRENNLDFFESSFPESMDVKITNYCDMGCKFCHENSNMSGKHGDILHPSFIDSLHPYTEIAIGGGNPLEHPDLIDFLKILKNKNIICNLTVNQNHFEKEQRIIKNLIDSKLIYGLGVSLTSPNKNFIEIIKQYPNAVIHTINGIHTELDFSSLANNGLKVLILGYKKIGRGKTFYSKEIQINQEWCFNNIKQIMNGFKVISFDNLALLQLDIRRLLTEKQWNKFYMGDDGDFTMYIDLVKQDFAKSSTSNKRYQLLDNIDDMFKIVKSEERNEIC
jgi:hypothetical protein